MRLQQSLAAGLVLAPVLMIGLVACAPSVPSASGSIEPVAPSIAATVGATPPVALASPSPSPTPSTGFAFGADAVLGFYEDAGFTCGGPQPSIEADGWTVQTCTRRDESGRRLGVGVVRDPQGMLGDGFASVTAADGEDFVNPVDALDHLAGFLGAMLGEARAAVLLEWLAGSMGNPYEETTDGDLRVATYLRPSDDPRTIWLEVADPAYLAAPRP